MSSYLNPSKRKPRQPCKWHIYDNKGSYNGWFDWLPQWMRVGYWSPVAIVFIAAFYSMVCLCVPQPLEFAVVTGHLDMWWWADVFVFGWGCVVFAKGAMDIGVSSLLISYTGWSWALLTARAGLTATGPLFATTHPAFAASVSALGSSLRLPAAVGATITFTIWNCLLLPIISLAALKGEQRQKFLRFNFGFTMINIHILNLPLALVNTVYGEGARLFTPSDLWAAYLVMMLYSMLYLFVLDRLGLHFYPMFCPRTAACAVAFGAILALYYYLAHWGNALMVHLQPTFATAAASAPPLELQGLTNVGDLVAQVWRESSRSEL